MPSSATKFATLPTMISWSPLLSTLILTSSESANAETTTVLTQMAGLKLEVSKLTGNRNGVCSNCQWVACGTCARSALLGRK